MPSIKKEVEEILLKLVNAESLEVSLDQSAYSQSSLDCAIFLLELFNLADQENYRFTFKSLLAKNFVHSLYFYIKEDFSIVGDWDTNVSSIESQKNILNFGSNFLKQLEDRRVNNLGSKNTIKETYLSAILIKANVEDKGEPHFLTQLNLKNKKLQFIASVKELSGLEEIQRIINKELISFKKVPYTFNQITEKKEVLRLSAKDSIYKKFIIDTYQISFNEPIRLGDLDRWVSISELVNGKTEDGIDIISLVADKYDPLEYRTFLQELPFSTNIKFKLKKQNSSNNNIEFKIKNLLDSEESELLEFKSSLRWDYREQKVNKDLEKVIAKTIVAFMNSNGGTLVIGLDDSKKILGLDKDFGTLKIKSSDGFLQQIMMLIANYIGSEFSNYVNASIEMIDGKHICIINIAKAPKGIFLKDAEKREFYIRSLNASKLLNSEEVVSYIQMHW